MERIGGVDVARGLAVLGMMTAHVGVAGDDLWSTDGWLGIADGRSAALFAVLAGVSIALLSGGTHRPAGDRLRVSRVRILVRGALLLLLGTVLASLGAPIAVILQSYGLLFAMVLPVLRQTPRSLVTLAAVVAVVGPPLCFALTDLLTTGDRGPTGLLDLLVDGYYPAGVWLAYVLAGMAAGRSDLRSPGLRLRLLVAGAVLAVVGYGGGVLATRLAAGEPGSTLRLLSTEPHADSTPEVTGNIGVALVVVAVCLVVADRWPRAVFPLASTGALALTAYSVHIVAIAALGPQVVREPEVDVHLGFLVVTVVLATLWRLRWRRGPFEWAMHEISTSVAATAADGAPVQEPVAGPGAAGPGHAGPGHAGPGAGGRVDQPPGRTAGDPSVAPQGQTSVRSQPSPPRR